MTIYKKGTKRNSETKSQRVKDFDFTFIPDDTNYLGFLHTFLESQDETKFQVTRKERFSFKYTYPPSKPYVDNYCSVKIAFLTSQYSVRDAADVDNERDYTRMVEKILHDKPKKV